MKKKSGGRRARREKIRKKNKTRARKRRKVAKHCVFSAFCGSGGLKSRLAKAAGAETFGERRNENCTQLWRETEFELKRYKAPHHRTAFGSCDVEKVHAVVARNTFRSQSVQNIPPFWHEAHFQV